MFASGGLDPERVAFDPLRLRVVRHRDHENPLAAPVYHAHRDTWYAHPLALIAWWIPLDELAAPETFEFYPDHFAAPVDNDSEVFDYSDWVRDGWELKIGWQKLSAGLEARYPQASPGASFGRAVGFSCGTADNLLFSGAHLHVTLPHPSAAPSSASTSASSTSPTTPPASVPRASTISRVHLSARLRTFPAAPGLISDARRRSLASAALRTDTSGMLSGIQLAIGTCTNRLSQ